MHGETLLGPIPGNYGVQELARHDGVHRTYFLNNDTGALTMGDPRLEPIPFPQGWLFLKWGLEIDDPIYCPLFINKEQQKIVPYDPRMTMCALIERGVNIETVHIV